MQKYEERHIASIIRSSLVFQTLFKDTQYCIYVKRVQPIDVTVPVKWGKVGEKDF